MIEYNRYNHDIFLILTMLNAQLHRLIDMVFFKSMIISHHGSFILISVLYPEMRDQCLSKMISNTFQYHARNNNIQSSKIVTSSSIMYDISARFQQMLYFYILLLEIP